MDKACSTHTGETRNSYKIFIGKPQWKGPFRRQKIRGKDNSMGLKEAGLRKASYDQPL
jgi:hypothetical protein